jgi:hypothetical protein
MNLTVENNQVILTLSVEKQTAANAIAAGQRAFTEAERSKAEADRASTAKTDTETLKGQAEAAAILSNSKATAAETAAQQTAEDRAIVNTLKTQTETAAGLADTRASAAETAAGIANTRATAAETAANQTAQDRLITGHYVTAAAGHAGNALSEANRAAQERSTVQVLRNEVQSIATAQNSVLTNAQTEAEKAISAAVQAGTERSIAVVARNQSEAISQQVNTLFQGTLQAKNDVDQSRSQVEQLTGQAQTAQQAAESSATTASQAAENASSQANLALVQAGISTAQAETATAKANEAGQSAVAAQTAQQEAETAKQETEAARDQANSIINQGIYGVEWNRTLATTVCTRVGDMSLHHAVTGLPVHNRMRRCLLLDDGTVNYYLDPNDSTLRDDGSAANLDGSDGQVMVEIPEHWRRFDTDGDIQRVLIAEAPFRGSHRVPVCYVSAFEATVFRPTSLLSSVKNLSTDYRGGNNNSAWDSEDRSLLGMPATIISRINFLAFARNRGANWHPYLYEVHKTVFWLFTVEYATRNTQLAFNNTLTVDGYRQGGLGNGVTNINSTDWINFNSRYPIIQCGSGNADNFNGSIAVTHPVLGSTEIPQYRGIEHPFGHIWKWTEGVNFRTGNNRSMIYKATSLNFRSSDYQGYEYIGDMGLTSAFIREITFGSRGDIFASNVTEASSTTFWADRLFQSLPSSGESLRGLLLGGNAVNGSSAGFVSSFANSDPSDANANFGSRLCFAKEMGA